MMSASSAQISSSSQRGVGGQRTVRRSLVRWPWVSHGEVRGHWPIEGHVRANDNLADAHFRYEAPEPPHGPGAYGPDPNARQYVVDSLVLKAQHAFGR